MRACPWKGIISAMVGTFLVSALYSQASASQCMPFNYSASPAPDYAVIAAGDQAEETASVAWELFPAPLRPQVETLLREQWGVQNVVWYAEQGHFWPTQYTLTARSWDDLLSNILNPYKLRVRLHSNHTAVIDYLPGVESAQ